MRPHDLEQRLRDELRELARAPVPSVAGRVLARLHERPQGRRGRLPSYLAAAALALVAALAWTGTRAEPARPVVDASPAPPNPPALAPPLLPRLALDAPVAPEAALRDEGRRLALDTRRAAVSLWDALPMSELLSREFMGRAAD
jgi:hypothetical protein